MTRALWLGFWFLVGFALVVALAISVNAPADAATTTPTAQVRIPTASVQYRVRLERAAAQQFGLNAPVARLAAQIHQESAWRPDAESPFAQGLAQFTPSTAAWLPDVCPEVGTPDVWDPGWSIRAVACYDAYLYARVSDAATDCDRWAMTLGGYNGGETWRKRDQRLARAAGADPAVWFGNVERHSPRAAWAIRENRAYVRRILLVLEPAYIAAAWPGKAVCA